MFVPPSGLIGAITFGFALDDRVAQELAHVTRAQVNLVSSGKLAGSSLDAAEQQEIRTALAASSSTGTVKEITEPNADTGSVASALR